MIRTNGANDRGLTCEAYMWCTQGALIQDDEEHAFRYKVSEHEQLIGYIPADRARRHPHVMWECLRVGETQPFGKTYNTVDEAFAALKSDD